jgi:hypothetical protein
MPQSTQGAPSERLEIAYTAKPVSGWGGLVALVRYFDKVGVRALLQQALPDGRTSPNQIPAGEIILAFVAAVLTGATRFAHVERLRADAVVRAILGVARMPSAMTLTRYLGGFARGQVEHCTEALWRFTLARLPYCGTLLTKWNNSDGVQPRPSESPGEENDTAGAAQRPRDGIPQACSGRFQQRRIILARANVSRRVGLSPFGTSKAVSQREK